MLTIAAAITGCKDEPPGKLFDEEGVWSMLSYDLGEGQTDIKADSRRDAFLMHFQPEESVVTAATCGMEGADDPRDSVCRLSEEMTGWTCRCFGYAFEESTMQWREFMAGDPPPRFSFEPQGAGDGGGGGDTSGTAGAGPGDDTYVQVQKIGESGATILFQPLPLDLFGSDGMLNRFEFVERAASTMAEVYEDPQFACTPCI
jgi:hypothetical protein